LVLVSGTAPLPPHDNSTNTNITVNFFIAIKLI